ncbi:hypothetical protein COO60DRAFT_629911 [Scenedesmus sp. NREL 46B-D3]|nr:hypothetical protein COO60DRAFT_629911 [Scenedesmus sp. NREL 46B-D3]
MRRDLCKAAALREELLADINSRVAPYRDVNATLHFAKRGALALVPFAVHATNALGLVRLARRVLTATGMGSCKQAKRAVTGEAGTAGAKVTAFESVGEVYGLIVQGSVVGEALAAAATASSVAAGTAAALDTVSLLDAFTLGTVCVVTGMVSAWGAAVCRPATVDGMARAIAAQQLAAAVQPNMRVVTCSREDSSNSSTSAATTAAGESLC